MTTIEKLREVVASAMMFDIADVTEERFLRDIPSYDSVNMLIMLVELEDQTGLHVPADRAGQLKCFGDVVLLAKEQGILEG